MYKDSSGKYNYRMTDKKGTHGPVILIGSGETSSTGGVIFEKLAKHYGDNLRIAIIETPAGFELNSNRVAGRVGDYLSKRLQNYHPVIDIIPARKRGGLFSPDNESILEPLYSANVIFLGPGSPTYAARQLEGSLAYEILQVKQRTGTALVLASAATIAFGSQTLPVYEIFKAGMDLHWQSGLNFFQYYGRDIVIIPHWNNTQGGDELDTSHCFIGEKRFAELRALLKGTPDILGIDEHTSVWIEPDTLTARVYGKGFVHLYHDGEITDVKNGQTISLAYPGYSAMSFDVFDGIRPEVIRHLLTLDRDFQESPIEQPPENIKKLAELRDTARKAGDFKKADELRKQMEDAGWRVQDTASGSQLERFK